MQQGQTNQQPAGQQPAKRKRKMMVPRVVDGKETMVEIEVEETEGGARWGPNDRHTLLNKSLPRVDAPVKVSGAARYTHDVRLPGMLYARILRSPHAHARLLKIDATRAMQIPGVLGVVAANPRAVIEGIRRATETADRVNPPEVGKPGEPREAGHVIHFEGEPVAAVAAVTPEVAEDGVRALVVEYQKLPHAVTMEDALAPNAPKVLAEGNLEAAEKRGDKEKTAAAFDECDAVIDEIYRTPIVHHACLETHGVVIDYRGGTTATAYASTQWTFSIPAEAAEALGLPASAVTAEVEHMGGGFGAKFGIGIEGMLACALSKQTSRPVKLMMTRHDEFVAAGNRSGSWQRLKGGAKRDGTFFALDARQHRLGGLGDGSQAGQPYVYKVQNSYREVFAVHTNEDSSRAMRAPGHPQASFAVESLVDELAHKLGVDPLEFRKKNLVDEGLRKGAVYHRQLDRGAREIGWERRNRTPGAGAGPLKRGIGCAVGTWGAGGGPRCVVDVTIARDGAVTVACGTQDLGTGTRTYTRAIVAEELGLQVNEVSERIGNSRLGASNPSGGSTTVPSLAPAIKDAAFNARNTLAARVAPLLGVAPEQVTFAGGRVSGGGKSLTWKQACAALPAAGLAARGEWKPGLSERGVHGACFAEVEVDVETGYIRPVKMVHVQDIGLPLNRLAVKSQMTGGMIQSLGMALYERRVMDARLGVMLNPGFGDYKLPGSLEMPELVAIIDDDDTREAVIGVGEPALIPSVGALANAVFNACGVRVRELPITPDKILSGLAAKGGQRA
ncbi:MAG TPA: xanthine dehydrogenase family protein molybdopterin-binding subunit [Pyrinomonadaceae bacterium]|nr:xanthine dehydrogenase family protein molybdopterin-binding subunit [Pyrinomonadaceae bacterium]